MEGRVGGMNHSSSHSFRSRPVLPSIAACLGSTYSVRLWLLLLLRLINIRFCQCCEVLNSRLGS